MWQGEPKEFDDLFRLTKKRREARAVLVTHQFGWEVRLLSAVRSRRSGRRSAGRRRKR